VQLVELQKRLPELTRGGYAVFAVSYDPVPVLAAFAERWGISYLLLSDDGSRVIRALGLTNQHLAEQSSAYGGQVRDHHHGVPYPGIFTLDETGIVVEKRFEQSYRHRPSGAALVEALPGIEPVDAAVVASTDVGNAVVRAWLADASYRPYQQLLLHVAIEPASGHHVYAEPVPLGFVPLQVALEPFDGLRAEPAVLPPAARFSIAGLDETFHGYADPIRVVVPFSIDAARGTVRLTVLATFQSCDDHVCYPPATVRLDLNLTMEDLIRD
jgi:peroxiredoxin